MHKFNIDIPEVSAAYEGTVKGLHKDNRLFVQNNKADIESSYQNYLNKVMPCSLESLTPLYQICATDSKEQQDDKDMKATKMRSLYDSKKAFRITHWKNLVQVNGGTQLLCPLCGVNPCRVTDHYAPREKFAEFSVFSPNLIPLCNDCNEFKSDLWVNATNGNRLVFNAFFDKLPSYELFECEISIVADYPYAKIKLSPHLMADAAREERIISTIEKLHILKILQEQSGLILNKEIQRLLTDYRSGIYDCFEAFWKSRCSCYNDYCTNGKVWNFLERIIFYAISNSEDVKKWVEKTVIHL